MSELLTFAECWVMHQKGECSRFKSQSLNIYEIGNSSRVRVDGGLCSAHEVVALVGNPIRHLTPIYAPRQIVIENVRVSGVSQRDDDCRVTLAISERELRSILNASRITVEVPGGGA